MQISSGGEQQRVAIARAMVNSPSLILADEPTGNLDTENSENVFEVIQELAESENLGVLIVTHNSELASKTNKLIRMKDGLIIKERVTLAFRMVSYAKLILANSSIANLVNSSGRFLLLSLSG